VAELEREKPRAGGCASREGGGEEDGGPRAGDGHGPCALCSASASACARLLRP
jgi:hypothetical protein